MYSDLSCIIVHPKLYMKTAVNRGKHVYVFWIIVCNERLNRVCLSTSRVAYMLISRPLQMYDNLADNKHSFRFKCHVIIALSLPGFTFRCTVFWQRHHTCMCSCDAVASSPISTKRSREWIDKWQLLLKLRTLSTASWLAYDVALYLYNYIHENALETWTRGFMNSL